MIATSIDEVLDLYGRWGDDRYDEALSQLEHGLQTAAIGAADGADEPLIVAALLHDVGHLLELEAQGGPRQEFDVDLGHESVGARYLSGLFPTSVTAPIALHVRAKRYRCAVDPAYLAALSAGSVRSLELQGGPMDDAECSAFRTNPGYADAVRLRGWDDSGKVLGIDVGTIEDHLDRILRVATAAT